jgi:hypothetical protein
MGFLVAAAWDIASRIAMAHPDLLVLQSHERGGYFPALSLACSHSRIGVDLDGGVEVRYNADGLAGDLAVGDWRAAAQSPRGSAKVAAAVVRYCQFDRVKHPMTARSLTYRLIARALAARMFDVDDWDVLCQYQDSTDLGTGIRWPLPHPEMRGLPANQVWVMTCNDKPTTWLWEGWAWTARGDRIDLMSEYAMGARLDLISPHLTELVAATRAPDLPAVDVHGSQPVGTWPRPGG